jgi:hypothetical protein
MMQVTEMQSSVGPLWSDVLQVERPKRRTLLDGFADVNDFRAHPLDRQDFRVLWQSAAQRLSPYCLDPDQQRVIFVETPEGINLIDDHPFLYEAQRRRAVKLYAVPYASVVALAAEIPNALKHAPVIFLHSTGRCGSTLLCRLLGDAAGTVSVSEPDFYSQLVLLREGATPADEARLAQITAACTQLLVAHLHAANPAAQSVVIKLRGVVVSAADLLARDLPNAQHLFLYRNATDTVDSFFAMLMRVRLMRVARRVGLETVVLRLLALANPMKRNPGALAPLYKQAHYREQIPEDLAAFLTIGWLSKMDHVLTLQRDQPGFFGALLRYEDLRAHGASLIMGLLEALGLPPADEVAVARMSRTLSRNAQEGSVLASTGESALRPRQREMVQRMLALHPEIHKSDYILPGTLEMKSA